jgi:hypothetical protein
VKIAESDLGFAAALVMHRCQESLRQCVLFASLPDGRILSWESFLALEDLVLESLNQGFLCITNETFRRLRPNSRGERTLYRAEGEKDYKGWLGGAESDDRIDRLGRPEWLNIDDRLGIRFAGPGETIYHNRHYFRPYRAVADDLTLPRLEEARTLRAGEATRPLAALLVPEQKHAETPASQLCVLAGPENSACLAADGYLAAANFGAASRVCSFTTERSEIVPAYDGATVDVARRTMRCGVRLSAWAACLLEASRAVRLEGDARIDTTLEGAICIRNNSSRPVHAEVVTGAGAGARVTVAPGKVETI